MPFDFEQQRAYEALARLFEVAKRDTGQSRRVASFLLAWHNAEENGAGILSISGTWMKRSQRIC